MYTPDPRIIRALRRYDRDLDAHWDSWWERWVITWRGKEVSRVQNEDGSYRPLDERLLTWARRCDAWRHKSGAEYLRIMDEENHRLSQRQKAAMRDEYEQMMKEDGYRMVFGGPMIQAGIDLKQGAQA